MTARKCRCAGVAAIMAAGAAVLLAAASAAPGLAVRVQSDAETLLAAGDIAVCGTPGDEATAAILDGNPSATVAALGDLAYENGTLTEFQTCYEPSWGRHKARTRPAVGNHEYHTPGAAGYFDYWGTAAGDRDQGYYSYDLGDWHVVVLNSNCEVVSCAAGSAQEQWLRADLTAHAADCTLAYWHHPRWSSSAYGDNAGVAPFWDALYEHGAEIVLNGHAHIYERFALQTPAMVRDDSHGIRQFIVGTGGRSHYDLWGASPNSELRHTGTFGVLGLTLRDTGYDWEFLPESGQTFTDVGSGTCHGEPDLAPPESSPTISSGHSGWSSDNTVDVTWTGATDAGSGVDGFSFSWTQQPDSAPDLVKDAEETASSATSGPLPDGESWFHLRTRDNAGNWSAPVHYGPFQIDTAAPASPSLSASHGASWSPDTTVDVTWTGATDGRSGVDGYSFEWSQSSTTDPDLTKDAEETAGSATSPALADGQWWFHIRTRDNADNWSGTVHDGPFRVDTAVPANPGLSTTHTTSWSPHNTLEVAWSGAADGHSGVDGYSYGWTQSPSTTPDDAKDAEETAGAATSAALADGEWWFHLRTRDNAGNWSAAAHLGPFRIDTLAPGNPTLASPSHTPGEWSNDPSAEIAWTGANDAHSAVDGFSYDWTQQATSSPDAAKDAEEAAGSTISPTLADGDWWFHLRTRDNAGNWSTAVHIGPFRIDTVAPVNPAVSSPSHQVGTWSNEPTVVIRWSAGAGEAYSYEWSASGTTEPDTEAEGSSSSVESVRPDGASWFHLRTRSDTGAWSHPSHVGPFLIDTAPPETSIASGPSGSEQSTSATFSFTSEEGATFECALDDASFAPCSSPTTYPGVGYGGHVFHVRATDRARNVETTPAERRWTVVAAPPPPPPPPSPPQPPPPPPPPADPPPKRPPVRAKACVVPRLNGRKLTAVRTMATRAGCRLGRVKKVYSTLVDKGRVMSQSPRPGRRLARGSRVNVVVSLGPAPRRR